MLQTIRHERNGKKEECSYVNENTPHCHNGIPLSTTSSSGIFASFKTAAGGFSFIFVKPEDFDKLQTCPQWRIYLNDFAAVGSDTASI